MKILDNIGLGLFMFSIVSVIFWSPKLYSISHNLDSSIVKISENEIQIWEKTNNMPFKINSATKDMISGMNEKIEDNKNLNLNSLSRTNEEIIKPTSPKALDWVENPTVNILNNKNSLSQTKEEIMKPISLKPLIWVENPTFEIMNKHSSTLQENLNKGRKKKIESKDASVEIEKRNLKTLNIASDDLKDMTNQKNAAIYKQTTTFDQTKNFAKEKASHIINNVGATIEKVDEWVANNAHNVFDKSGAKLITAENEVDKIINVTFQRMDIEKPIEFPNNNVSNYVGLLENKVCYEDVNESNSVHNNLQLLGTNNIDDDVENSSNVVHNNVQLLSSNNIEGSVENVSNIVHNKLRLLGVDNSNDFIIEDAHKKSQELSERWDQMSKDTGLNMIEQSMTGMNNLSSAFVGDEVNNKLNFSKEFKYKSNYDQPIKNLNEKNYEDTNKHHHEVSTQQYNENIKKHQHEVIIQQYKHLDDDYYDVTNNKGIKERMGKYYNDMHDKIGETHKRYRPKIYNDYIHQYGEERSNDVKNKAGKHYRGVQTRYDGTKIGGRVGTLYDDLLGTYKGTKNGASVGYKFGKRTKGAKNHIRQYYQDTRHTTSESYKIAKDIVGKVEGKLQRRKYNTIEYDPFVDYVDDPKPVYDPFVDYVDDSKSVYDPFVDYVDYLEPVYDSFVNYVDDPEPVYGSENEDEYEDEDDDEERIEWERHLWKAGYGNPATTYELKVFLQFVWEKAQKYPRYFDVRENLHCWRELYKIAKDEGPLDWTDEMENYLRELEFVTKMTYYSWALPNRRSNEATSN